MEMILNDVRYVIFGHSLRTLDSKLSSFFPLSQKIKTKFHSINSIFPLKKKNTKINSSNFLPSSHLCDTLKSRIVSVTNWHHFPEI